MIRIIDEGLVSEQALCIAARCIGVAGRDHSDRSQAGAGEIRNEPIAAKFYPMVNQ